MTWLLTSIAMGAQTSVRPLKPSTARVTTDRTDYPPGDTAVISGSGFAPGETVTLQVLHADGTPSTGDDHEPWTATADPLGKFQTSWHVCEDDCLGSLLRLTARGRTSGLSAMVQFTDDAPPLYIVKEYLTFFFSTGIDNENTVANVPGLMFGGEADPADLSDTQILITGQWDSRLADWVAGGGILIVHDWGSLVSLLPGLGGAFMVGFDSADVNVLESMHPIVVGPFLRLRLRPTAFRRVHARLLGWPEWQNHFVSQRS